MSLHKEDSEKDMTQCLQLRGILKGHRDWVTQISTNTRCPDVIISSSRDKSLIVWKLTAPNDNWIDSGIMQGKALRSLKGHGHFVSDVNMSADGQFALSGSWDATLRLWDLQTGKTVRRFVSHKKDVLSVSFSADNRQIISGSRDKSVKLWNTLAQCKYTIENCHKDWVSCTRFSPCTAKAAFVSAGWDKVVKVWNLRNCDLRTTYHYHSGFINTIAVSPCGSLCASGGKDGDVMLWDLNEERPLCPFKGTKMVNALAFSPNRYWLSAGIGSIVKVWDLENKVLVDEAKLDATSGGKSHEPECVSVSWSPDGQMLYAGYTDCNIRIWEVCMANENE